MSVVGKLVVRNPEGRGLRLCVAICDIANFCSPAPSTLSCLYRGSPLLGSINLPVRHDVVVEDSALQKYLGC